jgi:hypothetical protein
VSVLELTVVGPHNGPIFTYLARCPNDDCTTFYGDEEPVWFKIGEQ